MDPEAVPRLGLLRAHLSVCVGGGCMWRDRLRLHSKPFNFFMRIKSSDLQESDNFILALCVDSAQ